MEREIQGSKGTRYSGWRGKYRAGGARDTVGGEGNTGQQGHETVGGEGNIGQQGHETQSVEREL